MKAGTAMGDMMWNCSPASHFKASENGKFSLLIFRDKHVADGDGRHVRTAERLSIEALLLPMTLCQRDVFRSTESPNPKRHSSGLFPFLEGKERRDEVDYLETTGRRKASVQQ